jgi:hypothetical protein
MGSGEDEGANQIAHHVVEEAVGGDTVDEEAAGDDPLRVGDGADGGCWLLVAGCWLGGRPRAKALPAKGYDSWG